MSCPKKPVMFKHEEILHLLSMIDQRQEDGWYFGSRETFLERERAIKAKLQIAANTRAKLRRAA